MSQADHVFKPGDEINDRYVIVEWIGAGGMADVYKAYDKNMKDYVALKAILPEHLKSPEQAELMADMMSVEAQRGGRLHKRISRRGRHVVPVTDTGITNLHSLPFCVMELLDGSALSDQIASRRLAKNPFKLHVSLRIARSIAIGLSYIHIEKYVHRDIKPGNIWLSASDEHDELDVLICDMGLLFSMADDQADGVFKGTPRYACPSLFLGEPPTAAVDAYALGLLIYEMIAGKGPFDDPKPPKADYETWRSLHVHAAPRPLRQLNSDVPDGVESLVMSLIRKSPGERPTMKQTYIEIKRLVEGLPDGQAVDFKLVKVPANARHTGEPSEGQLHRLKRMAQSGGTLVMGKRAPAAPVSVPSRELFNSVTGASKTGPIQVVRAPDVDPRKADTRSMPGVPDIVRALRREADTLDPLRPTQPRPAEPVVAEPPREDPSKVYKDPDNFGVRESRGRDRSNAAGIVTAPAMPIDDVDGLLSGVGADPPPAPAASARPDAATSPKKTTRFGSSLWDGHPAAQSGARAAASDASPPKEELVAPPWINTDGSVFERTPTQNLAFDLLLRGADVPYVANKTSLPTAKVQRFCTFLNGQIGRWNAAQRMTNEELYTLCHEQTGRQLACDLLFVASVVDDVARLSKISVEDVRLIDEWIQRLFQARDEYERQNLSPDAIVARYRQPPVHPTPLDAAMDMRVPDEEPIRFPQRRWYTSNAARVAIAAASALFIPLAGYQGRTSWRAIAARQTQPPVMSVESPSFPAPVASTPDPLDVTAAAASPSPVAAPLPAQRPPTTAPADSAGAPVAAKHVRSVAPSAAKPAQTTVVSNDVPPSASAVPAQGPASTTIDRKRLQQMVLEDDEPTTSKAKPRSPGSPLPTENAR